MQVWLAVCIMPLLAQECLSPTYVLVPHHLHTPLCCFQELRRVRSGIMGEKDNMITMHDVLDAQVGTASVQTRVYYPCLCQCYQTCHSVGISIPHSGPSTT